MTTEEKARAYDEVLNKLRHFIAKGVDPLITRADAQDFFPELKESDDEKIRKDIIWCLKHSGLKESNPINPHVTTTTKDAISWLEKMFPELKEDENERIRKEIINFLEHPNIIVKKERRNDYIAWLEKQGEKDKLIKELGEYKVKYTQEILSLQLEKQAEQKPAWSEEDEAGLGDAMWAIEQARTIAKDENDMGNLWYAEHWLKSLKERCTWKPSDEQMRVLDLAIRCGINRGTTEETTLVSLFNDLKKLK